MEKKKKNQQAFQTIGNKVQWLKNFSEAGSLEIQHIFLLGLLHCCVQTVTSCEAQLLNILMYFFMYGLLDTIYTSFLISRKSLRSQLSLYSSEKQNVICHRTCFYLCVGSCICLSLRFTDFHSDFSHLPFFLLCPFPVPWCSVCLVYFLLIVLIKCYCRLEVILQGSNPSSTTYWLLCASAFLPVKWG